MLNAFDTCTTIFGRGLESLRSMLKKSGEHAAAQGSDADALLKVRLAGDMNDLGSQLHWATEGTKLALNRLLGSAGTPPGDAAGTLAAHQAKLEATLEYLHAIDARALAAGMERSIEIPHRGVVKSYRGDRFLTEFAIPNFYFHLGMAYAILRHQGVPLQKGDFLGG